MKKQRLSKNKDNYNGNPPTNEHLNNGSKQNLSQKKKKTLKTYRPIE